MIMNVILGNDGLASHVQQFETQPVKKQRYIVEMHTTNRKQDTSKHMQETFLVNFKFILMACCRGNNLKPNPLRNKDIAKAPYNQ